MNQYQRIFNILVEKEESGEYPNMVLIDGKWRPKPKKRVKGSSRTSTKYPPKVLRSPAPGKPKKWIEKK